MHNNIFYCTTPDESLLFVPFLKTAKANLMENLEINVENNTSVSYTHLYE